MSSSLLDHATRCLRLLALAVLVLGMLAKPILVAACELEDLGRAQVEAGYVVDDTGDSSGDACCPGQACGECCTATTMLPAATVMGRATALDTRPRANAWVESEPAPLPVANRPPIRA